MNPARVLLGIAVVAVAVVLLIVLKDDGGEGNGSGGATATTTQPNVNQKPRAKPRVPAIPTIAVRDGEPVGGVAELSFEAGDQVRFKVRSDAAEEIHVHGYDIAKEVGAGGSVVFDFPATIEGLFEVELEHLGVQIAELRVNP